LTNYQLNMEALPAINQKFPSTQRAWKLFQIISWFGGLVLLALLFFIPDIALNIFWNMLIPLAPMIFLIIPGTWRNICPMAIANLLPRKYGFSTKLKPSAKTISVFNLIGLTALYFIVPLRHAIFNDSGFATGMLILSMVFMGIILSFFYEWKSAWCSGFCPIHPVEKLYGSNALISVSNAHCESCANCIVPCPDSTPNIHPLLVQKSSIQQINGYLIIGGFPGFIWGWFQVPDSLSFDSLHNLKAIYLHPFSGLLISLICFVLIKKIIASKHEKKLIATFAASSISTYYWFRIPALFGFSPFKSEHPLIDLSATLDPVWLTGTTWLLIGFFYYQLVFRKQHKTSWSIRPSFHNFLKKQHTIPG
jgi:hypothetical protein